MAPGHRFGGSALHPARDPATLCGHHHLDGDGDMALRINIRKTKGLLWLGCLAALGYAGWSFYEIYEWDRTGKYKARSHAEIRGILESQQEASDAPQKQTFYPEKARKALWGARIDGSLPPPPVTQDDLDRIKDQKPVKEPLKALDQVLEINLIVWSPDASSRLIEVTYLEDKQGGGGSVAGRAVTGSSASVSKENRMHLAEGELLRGEWGEGRYNGRVLAIGPQEARFHWGEDEATLTPQLGVSGQGTPASEFDIPVEIDLVAALDEAPETTITLDDGSFVMGQDHLERIKNDGQSIFEQEVTVRTVTQPDRAHSFIELVNVQSGSVLDSYGFQSGDKIISVNGIPMPSLASAINWGKANSNLPSYTVVYERLGKQYTAVVHVKQ